METSKATLVRSMPERCVIEEEFSRFTAEQAAKYKETLGYAVSSQQTATQNTQRQQLELTNKLLDVFTELKIIPYTQDSVAIYQEAKLVEAEQEQDTKVLSQLLADKSKLKCSFVAWIISAFLLLGLAIMSFHGSIFISLVALAGAGLCAFRSGIFSTKIILCNDSIQTIEFYKSKWRWVAISLEYFRNEVPLQALDMASSIKERVTEAEFIIESMDTTVQMSDQFLVCRCNDEDYHIAAWDEPKFEAVLYQ